jgi:hypothetical protein
MTLNYIEQSNADWALEFASLLRFKPDPSHAPMIKAAMYAVAYEIADNFQNGQHREAILALLEIKRPPDRPIRKHRT